MVNGTAYDTEVQKLWKLLPEFWIFEGRSYVADAAAPKINHHSRVPHKSRALS
jgi:hypothetical protein